MIMNVFALHLGYTLLKPKKIQLKMLSYYDLIDILFRFTTGVGGQDFQIRDKTKFTNYRAQDVLLASMVIFLKFSPSE